MSGVYLYMSVMRLGYIYELLESVMYMYVNEVMVWVYVHE